MTSRRRLILGTAAFASAFLFAGASCGTVASDKSDSEADASSSLADAQMIDAAEEVCAKSPCDLFDQCGCQESQACDLDLAGLPAGDTECRDIDAAGRELDRCTQLEDCDEGYFCGGGQCLRYCENDEGCVEGEASVCIGRVSTGEGTNSVPGVRTCSKSCVPEGLNTANNCPADFACRILVANRNQNDEFNYSHCIIGGPGGNDAACSANGNNDCQPGFICVNFGSDGSQRCRQACRVDGGSSCTLGGQDCSEFGQPPILNGVVYGFCGVPNEIAPGAQPASDEPSTAKSPFAS